MYAVHYGNNWKTSNFVLLNYNLVNQIQELSIHGLIYLFQRDYFLIYFILSSPYIFCWTKYILVWKAIYMVYSQKRICKSKQTEIQILYYIVCITPECNSTSKTWIYRRTDRKKCSAKCYATKEINSLNIVLQISMQYTFVFKIWT